MPDNEKITADKVLTTIKQLYSRQKSGPQPVSIDTLTLVLRINKQELMPLIEELKLSRDIVFHPPKASAKIEKSGAVSLT